MSNDLRYPIGKNSPPAIITADDRTDAIRVLAEFPEQLRAALLGLDDDQLDTPYRPEGWTVRLLVHHVADSHATAVFRMRKALTEDWPEVPGYPEALFAELPDYAAPAEWSLNILEATHARWVMLLHPLTEEQWKRGVVHSQHGRMLLETMLMTYRWHSLHHLAHITSLRTREGW